MGAGLVDVETIVASRGLDRPESLALDVNDGRIYWTDWGMGRIMRGNAALDGTGVEAPVTGLRQPTGLALDVAGGRMYWIDSGRGRIQRAKLDGTSVETLVTGVGAQDLVLNPMSDLMYWTEPGLGRIRRATLSGVDVETLLSGLTEPGNLALDLEANRVYWIEPAITWSSGSIWRADLDGTSIETILAELENPVDLALTDRRIYWIGSEREFCEAGEDGCRTRHTSRFFQADLNGDNAGTFGPSRSSEPRGMAMDVGRGRIYWTHVGARWVGDFSTIRSVDLDGTNERAFTSPPDIAKPLDIALDTPGEQIYWIDTDAIHRAALDGTGIQTLVTRLGDPRSLALDLAGGKLYWTDSYIIQRSSLDGTNVERLFSAPLHPTPIALDVAGDRIYWTDEHTIRRANFDGTHLEVLVEGLEKPGMSLDLIHSKLYWTDSATATIRRSNLDGTNPETLVEEGPYPGEEFVIPGDIALDPVGGKMYCVYRGYDELVGSDWRVLIEANLDGSSIRVRGQVETWEDPAIAVLEGGGTSPLTPFVTIAGHAGTVAAVAFSPDGHLLASASHDSTIRLWQADTGLPKATLEHGAQVWGLAFSPDGQLLASAGGTRAVLLWDVDTGQPKASLEGHARVVTSVAFSPDGHTLASASHDSTIRLWQADTGLPKATLEGHTGGVMSVAFSPDGHTLASAGWDGTVRLWETDTGLPKVILEHAMPVWMVAFSPDGLTLASAPHDHDLLLWEVETGQVRGVLVGHPGLGNSVAFSPDGLTLASRSTDPAVRLWEAGTGQLKKTLTGPWLAVTSIAFSPDGQSLASGVITEDWDKALILWDLSGTLPRTTLVDSHSFSQSPGTSGLDPNYPNPFNRGTLIAYRLAAPGPVRLQIYNLLGQPLRTLVDEVQAPGRHRVEWDARDQRGSPVATGVYLTLLRYPGGVQTRQLLLLK